MQDKKLNLVWEDNADTPLRASNISKIVQTYKEGDLLFVDENDKFLKLRANSKILLKEPVTSAFYSFNKSFSSHNSLDALYPVQSSNMSFRKEGPRDSDEYSLAIESNTSNLLVNSGFEDGLTSWTVESSGQSTVTSSSVSESLFNKVAKISIDTFPHLAGLSQNKTLNSTNNLSLSFYYNSTSTLKFEFIGNPTITNYWWRDDESITGWVLNRYLYELPSTSGKWKRFELKNIKVILDDSKQTAIEEVKINIFSEENGTIYVDDVQLEEKSFCSSYTSSSRNNPAFLLKNHTITMDYGMIDFEMCVKNFNSSSNYIFQAKTADNDAMRLYFDIVNKKLRFQVYNTKSVNQNLEENFESCDYEFTASEFNSLIDKWIRILVEWDFTLDTKEMRIFLLDNTVVSKFDFIASATSFSTYVNSDITQLNFGGQYGTSDLTLAESLFKNVKFNIESKSSQKINSDLTNLTQPDVNKYNFFEVPNYDIVIDDILDTSSDYYVWLRKDDDSDTSSIILSHSNYSPYSLYDYYSRLIAKFSTDSLGKVIEKTITDLTIENLEPDVLQIESSMPTSSGRNGEIRLLHSGTVNKLIIYLDSAGWIQL